MEHSYISMIPRSPRHRWWRIFPHLNLSGITHSSPSSLILHLRAWPIILMSMKLATKLMELQSWQSGMNSNLWTLRRSTMAWTSQLSYLMAEISLIMKLCERLASLSTVLASLLMLSSRGVITKADEKTLLDLLERDTPGESQQIFWNTKASLWWTASSFTPFNSVLSSSWC